MQNYLEDHDCFVVFFIDETETSFQESIKSP